MAEESIEREDKYDVEASFQVPDLLELVPSGGSIAVETLRLRNVYFDTDEGDLLGNRVTLRRRYGGPDEGWHLKLPAAKDSRTEVRLPPDGARRPPRELLELTTGLRRGRPVRRRAELNTERTVHRLLDADGTLLVEVADDTVRATVGGDTATVSQWREVEVELGNGEEALLAVIGRRLHDAGAVPAGHASKLARALESATGDGEAPTAPESSEPRDPNAGSVVLAYLREQRNAVVAGDLGLRRGQDVVHPTRVATRRLRSTLRAFGSLFDADQASALDAELRWYAATLGEVRDRAVLRSRMSAALAELPEATRLGRVGADIDEHLLSETARHGAALARALNGRRYLTLLNELDRWVSDPPFTEDAAKKPKHVARLVTRAERQLARRLSEALETDDDDALHSARKAGKRARYAAELAIPVIGADKAERLITRYTALQDALGEYQDSVVAADVLLRLGRAAGTRAGENGFGYGVLYAGELQRRRAARDRAAELAGKLVG